MIWWLWAASALSMLGSIFYVLMYLAPEATQGFAMKIFFVHVPAAFTMYLFLFAAFVASIIYLAKRSYAADLVAKASMICSFIFSLLVVITGPLWAKPIWGVYWTWDPRLTTTFVVFVLICAYLLIRKIFEDRRDYARASLIGAILSIIAILDVPLIHFSVKLWRGVHPSVIKNPDGLPEGYQRGLEFMMISFFLLGACYFYIIWKYLKLKASKESHA